MSDIAISVRDLSKMYKIGAVAAPYKTFRESIVETIFNKKKTSKTADFWALQDVSFEVKRGDVLGIIGRNGAGKSTLLKILSRITEPTKGEIDLYGRVRSLLEVGTGFHPELTGRENIYLNGAILGMKRAEITKKFDEIVSFAEVEKFIDTPVKHYSSGMYMRLAFAVAAHLETEILMIDEILAVGDVAFQKKCLGKMGELASGGRTVIFVSHDMSVISSLTNTCLALAQGRVINYGKTADVIHQYLASSERAAAKISWQAPRPGDETFEFISCRIGDGEKEEFYSNEPVEIEMVYRVKTKIPEGLRVGFDLNNESGIHIFRAYHDDTVTDPRPAEPGIYRSSCVIPRDILNQGKYSLTIRAGIWSVRKICLLENVLSFSVVNLSGSNSRYGGDRPGILNPSLGWNTEKTGNA